MSTGSRPHVPATARPYGAQDRPLPVGIAVLIIAACSALGWAAIIAITAVLLQL